MCGNSKMNNIEDSKNILGGIVLYNPDIFRLEKVIRSIYKQVSAIVLYDNGSKNIENIVMMANVFPNVTLIKGKNNNGIAFALNRIFDFAEINKFEWVITLDHDTVCPENMVNEYLSVVKQTNAEMLCPNVIDYEIANNKYFDNSATEFSVVNRCIQTGNMIAVKLWRQVGQFDEYLFIDFVDFDFCKRVNIIKKNIYRCNRVVVDHELGHRKKTKLHKVYDYLFKHTKLNIFKYLQYMNLYSYDRAFYCARNNCIYIKKYIDYIDIKKEKKEMFLRIVKRIIRGKNHFMILKASFKGIEIAKKMEIDKFELLEGDQI